MAQGMFSPNVLKNLWESKRMSDVLVVFSTKPQTVREVVQQHMREVEKVRHLLRALCLMLKALLGHACSLWTVGSSHVHACMRAVHGAARTACAYN